MVKRVYKQTFYLFFIFSIISFLQIVEAEFILSMQELGAPVSAIRTIPRSGVLVAATLGKGIFLSDDEGDSWQVSNQGLTNYHVTCLEVSNENRLLAGTCWGGIFISNDQGKSWAASNQGLQFTHIRSIAMDPENFEILYVATLGGGIYRSEDGGKMWQCCSRGLEILDIVKIQVAPWNTNCVYAASFGNKLYWSKNKAESWDYSATIGTSNSRIRTLVLAPNMPLTILVGTYHEGIMKSTDGGEEWLSCKEFCPQQSVVSLINDLMDPYIFYAGTIGSGVFISTDSGQEWERIIHEDFNIFALAMSPTDPNTLLLGDYSGHIMKIRF